MANHFLSIDLIILFFFLGVVASWTRSDLDFPESISKFLSIFLLLSLGLKGGHEVRMAENLGGFGAVLAIGLGSCIAIPVYIFAWLKSRLGSGNAAALAAGYGSVSAVTLIAAQGYLTNQYISFSGYMVAVMALMEIPAIVVALFLYRRYQRVSSTSQSGSAALSVFAAKSVVLLLGGFGIGLVLNEPSWKSIAPVVQDSFKGFLAFFLLDLGIAAQRQLKFAWEFKSWALLVACVLPIVNGSVALTLATVLGVESGNSILLAVLAGSASYIAAPAAIRSSISSANPSLYVAWPLALTFPMNVLIGIPYYVELSRYLRNWLAGV